MRQGVPQQEMAIFIRNFGFRDGKLRQECQTCPKSQESCHEYGSAPILSKRREAPLNPAKPGICKLRPGLRQSQTDRCQAEFNGEKRHGFEGSFSLRKASEHDLD